MTTLTLVGIEDEDYGDPAHHRLVCKIQGGGLVAFWGSEGNRATIEQVRELATRRLPDPFYVTADWIEPAPWGRGYGHTLWLPETSQVIIPPDTGGDQPRR